MPETSGSPFLRFLGQRLPVGVLTLLGVATVVFALVHLLPGDPAETMLARSGASPEAVAALRAEFGLDRPLPVQYASWLGNFIRGDLGRSLFNGRPVAELIREQAPYTLALALAAFAWALLLGLTLGVVSAGRPGSLLDRLAMALAIGGVAVPVFWSGLLLIWLFSVRLGWLPPGGAEGWRTLVMPAFVLGYASAGPIARLTRTSLIEVLRQPYILAARARGADRRRVLLRHAGRNVALPVLTIAGLQLGFLLGGTVVTETLFNRPGLGKLLVDAILWRDMPLVQGVALTVATTYVLVNLAVDLAAGWLDPRVGRP
jgi:ABC-type dipeptide/oligopeptide/nickel transport system permease component